MKKQKIFTFLLIFIILIVNIAYADDINEEDPTSSAFQDVQQNNTISYPSINARSAVVMDFKTGRILYEKNAKEKRPMASTTKVMTAIVAIENGNFNDKVIVSKKAASTPGSTINLKVGEEITLEELLYGLMLKSGNDASIAIAEHIGGSVEKFLDLMNAKALQIGAYDTHFESPHGLDSNGHYSTAYDMALITKYALSNYTFSKIVGTKSIYAGGRSLSNSNEMLFMYEGADGVKTGYTGKAGRCLITSATRNEMRLISVVLFCDTRNLRASSSKSILDYSFGNYTYELLAKKNDILSNITVNKGIKECVPVHPSKDLILPLSQDEKDNLVKIILLPEKIEAPIKQNQKIGSIDYYVGEKKIASLPIVTSNKINRKAIPEFFVDVFYDWLKLMKIKKNNIAS